MDTVLIVLGSISAAISLISGIITIYDKFQHGLQAQQTKIALVVFIATFVTTSIFVFVTLLSLQGKLPIASNNATPTATLYQPTPTQTPSSTTQSTSTPSGSGSSYQFVFASSTFMNLDTGHADTVGGANDELYNDGAGSLEFGAHDGGRSTWAKTEVIIIQDSVASYQGCANATNIQANGYVYMNSVNQDQSICVSTNQGNWAVLKYVSGYSSQGYTFNVTLYHP